MKRFFILIAFLTAIPLFGFLSGTALLAHYDQEFKDAIGTSGEAANKSVSVTQACDSPRIHQLISEFCETYQQVTLMSDSSLDAIVAGLGLIFLIWIAGRMAGSSRSTLVALFGPGMRLVLLVISGLIVVQGAIAAYGAYIVEATLIHRVHFFLIGAVALGAVIGGVKMIAASISLSKPAPLRTFAIETTAENQSTLWNFVNQIADNLGSRRPTQIILGLEPSFYATASQVMVLNKDELLKGETIYLSLPLMRILTKPQFAAVVGHELGHFKGQDTAYSLRFVPIYSGVNRALHSLSTHEGASSFALLPAFAALNFFLEQFAVAERTIGRQRELEADQAGATVGGAKALGAALIKISALAGTWNTVEQAMIEMLNKGQIYKNASLIFGAAARGNASSIDKASIVAELATSRVSHPTDTHPSLKDRFDALGLDLNDASSWIEVEDDSSISLIEDAASVEESLTEIRAHVLLRLGAATLPEEETRSES